MPDFTLTSEQQQILRHPQDRHARVLAGPGTGKSATLVKLIDQLLSNDDAPKVRLLTFTRAATGELAAKVSGHPAAAAERPSTVHSFSISVLLQNPGLGEFPQPLRLADAWENEEIVYPSLGRRTSLGKEKTKELFRELAANWESLSEEETASVSEEERRLFLGTWQEHREVYGYTLLAELPYTLMHALREHEDLRGVDFDLLLVDEYQDLNACELRILRHMAERGCSVIGAGDDDQSIYLFRKAAPEGIRRFPEEYSDSADYPLSITHRCGSRIIHWARFVIESDPDRPRERPPLSPAPDSPDGEVALLSFAGHRAEAQGIARLTKSLIEDEGVEASGILILIRSDHNKAFSRLIQEELSILEIPYSDPDAVKQTLAVEVNRRLLSYFRILVNRTDSLAWASLLKLKRGIGDAFFDYIYHRARRARTQFGEELLEAHDAGFPSGPRGPCARAAELVQETLDWLETSHIPEDRIENWGEWLLEASGTSPLPEPTPHFKELVTAVDGLVETEVDLGRYLGQITPLGKDWAQTHSEGVRIMTMAGAKGLTVDATIIAGLEHSIIPHPSADQSEEHRLLYVAMTRARRYLFGTWARYRNHPTARIGSGSAGQRRNPTRLLQGGPVRSQDGHDFIAGRWGSSSVGAAQEENI